jgi:uncharacterized membrane protein YccC
MLAVTNIACLLGRSLDWLRQREARELDLQPARLRSSAAVGGWRRTELDGEGLQRRLIEAAAELPLARTSYSDPMASDEDVIRRVSAIGRLREFFAALTAFAGAHQALQSPPSGPSPRTRFTVANDRVGAAWAGVRAALSLLLPATFWILADWPEGSTAAILAAVATARLATMEYQKQMAIGATLVVVLATPPAFALVEILLPQASGFEMFSLVVAPFLFVCAFLMTSRKTAILGFMGALYFANTAAFTNSMVYNAIGFLNTSLAIALAIATAAVLYATVAPNTPEAARRAFVRVSRKTFGRIGERQHPIGLHEFDTAMAEALDLWRRGLGSAPNAAASVEAGVALLGIGRDLIRIRDDESPKGEKVRIGRRITQFLATGNRVPLERARRAAWHAAIARLRDLRVDELDTLQARAAAREMVAFAAMGDELERMSDLVRPANQRTPAHAA